MIAMITPLPIGNAIRVLLRPPANSSVIRLLRKQTDDFDGPDDAGAVLVAERSTIGRSETLVDFVGLVNGQTYYYRPYYLQSDWVEGASVVVVPQASYFDRSVDAFSVVLGRISAGLVVELARGTLSHETEDSPVLSAPPAYDQVRWPLVTIDLQNDAPGGRGLGELLEPDTEEDGEWTESEGWLAKTQMSIIGWSQNPDERIELRKALRRIVLGNLPVFEGAGLSEIEFSQQHAQDFESYNAPVYQVLCTLTCFAPALVSGNVGDISDVKTVVTVGP